MSNINPLYIYKMQQNLNEYKAENPDYDYSDEENDND